MKQEILISTAIIGAAAVAGVAIAGGPSGVFPPDEPELVIDGFGVDPDSTDQSGEPDETVEDAGDESGVDTPDAATSTTLARSPTPATTTPTTTPTTTTVAPTTTTLVLVDRAELAVAVGNGSGVGGAASAQAAELEATGYEAVRPANTDATPLTSVYAAPDFIAEGERLATDAGLPSSAVLPLADAPTIDAEGLYDLILILGDPASRPTTTTTIIPG